MISFTFVKMLRKPLRAVAWSGISAKLNLDNYVSSLTQRVVSWNLALKLLFSSVLGEPVPAMTCCKRLQASSAECVRKLFMILNHKTNEEASYVLCYVAKNLGSGRALKMLLNKKHSIAWGGCDFVSCLPLQFFRVLSLSACFKTEQSRIGERNYQFR